MIKTLLTLFCCLYISSAGAQTDLKFCVETGKDGNCQSASSRFNISRAGGTITFLIKNDKGLGTNKVLYKIFKLSEDGKETYNNTIEQQVKENWNFAWEDAVFYDPGTYKILVYDKSETGPLICMGILKLFTQ